MKSLNVFYQGLLLALGALLLCVQASADDAAIIVGIKNLKTPALHYLSGGQATAEQFSALAGQG